METLTYKVTDQKEFDKLLEDVTIHSQHTGEHTFYGIVTLHYWDGTSQDFQGEHSYNDFKELYGFVIEKVPQVAQS